MARRGHHRRLLSDFDQIWGVEFLTLPSALSFERMRCMARHKRDRSTPGTDPLFANADQRKTKYSGDYSSPVADDACSNQCASVDDATGYSREEEEVESMREEAS